MGIPFPMPLPQLLVANNPSALAPRWVAPANTPIFQAHEVKKEAGFQNLTAPRALIVPGHFQEGNFHPSVNSLSPN